MSTRACRLTPVSIPPSPRDAERRGGRSPVFFTRIMVTRIAGGFRLSRFAQRAGLLTHEKRIRPRPDPYASQLRIVRPARALRDVCKGQPHAQSASQPFDDILVQDRDAAEKQPHTRSVSPPFPRTSSRRTCTVRFATYGCAPPRARPLRPTPPSARALPSCARVPSSVPTATPSAS